MTDLKHTGSGNEYEEGRGPEGTEPSKNLKKDLFVLKTYTCEYSVKDFFVQNSLLEDVPPPMRGKMWIPRMVGQRMVGRPDPRITIR